MGGGGRFLDDVGKTNARRSKCAPGSSDGTDYFYDIMSQPRGCPGDEMPPSHRRCNESSSWKRACDSTLLVLLTTTCHPVTGIHPVAFYFSSSLPYYLLRDDRRLGELMGVDIMNERGHGKGDDGDDKDETVHKIYIEPLHKTWFE